MYIQLKEHTGEAAKADSDGVFGGQRVNGGISKGFPRES